MTREFLDSIRAVFHRLTGTQIYESRPATGNQKDAELFFDDIGEYDYNHYLWALDDVSQLKRDGRYDEAEALLQWCIDYAEAEQLQVKDIDQWGDLPASMYEELADVYRETGRKERAQAVLQRYVRNQRRIGAPVGSDVVAAINADAPVERE